MSDNPFAEPGDSDRTIIRPPPGRRAAAPAAPQSLPQEPVAPLAAAATLSGEGAEAVRIGATPLLAAAGPLLALLARLRNTASQPEPGDLRARALAELRRFETTAREAGVPLEQLRPAHYVLCAALDDVVLNTPWGSAGAWAHRTLVATMHQEVRGGERFFDLLAQLRQHPATAAPVLEVMYYCLSLGFQGRYRLSQRGMAELEQLREDLYALLTRQRPAAEAGLSPQWRGVAAPYVPARGGVPVWVAGVAALSALAGLFLFLSFGLNGQSDAVYAQMAAAPPLRMPQIARAHPAAPPPPPPAAAMPVALDHLRQFLKPEIDQNLVTVFGTPGRTVVRIRNAGMFASGSASVGAAATGLLDRIGRALAEEKGDVEVVGYTDNAPVHTARFPSNFQLSLARAQAARALIVRALGEPGRVAAEGRADADPIAPNTTPEGREANRRIEVVLRRPI